jgi:hypothetical protein
MDNNNNKNNNNNNISLLHNNSISNSNCILGNHYLQYQYQITHKITWTQVQDGDTEVSQILIVQKVVQAQLRFTSEAEAALAGFELSKLHSHHQTPVKISSFGPHTFCQLQERIPSQIFGANNGMNSIYNTFNICTN